MQVVAAGRADWIGWVELRTEQVDELAMTHTAMVIRDIDADVLGVVEADNRPVLQMFSAALLKRLGAKPYEQVMLVDGNDDRGIDVGILARGGYPLEQIAPTSSIPTRTGSCSAATAASTTCARRAGTSWSCW